MSYFVQLLPYNKDYEDQKCAWQNHSVWTADRQAFTENHTNYEREIRETYLTFNILLQNFKIIQAKHKTIAKPEMEMLKTRGNILK